MPCRTDVNVEWTVENEGTRKESGHGKWVDKDERATSQRAVQDATEQTPGWSEGVRRGTYQGLKPPDRRESHRSGPEMVQMFEVLEEPSARKPVELESSEQGQVVRYEGERSAGQGPPGVTVQSQERDLILPISKSHCVLPCQEQVRGGMRETRETSWKGPQCPGKR